MSDAATTTALLALPVQLIQVESGVHLRRGCVEMRIEGEAVAAVVAQLFEAAARGELTADQLCETFAAPIRQGVAELIAELTRRELLVSADGRQPTVAEREGPLEIFYWHFGERPPRVNARLETQRIAVVGVNEISRRLAATLASAGAAGVEVVDDALLRNVRLFDGAGALRPGSWPNDCPAPMPSDVWHDRAAREAPGCVVATSDFGGVQLIRQWNDWCVARGLDFLPVILKDLIGYVGPLVVPGETACYECTYARWNANAGPDSPARVTDLVEFDRQAVVGNHPALASVLGDIGALELTKFYGLRLPLNAASRLIEVNLLASRMHVRRVLKVPRCPVCGTLNRRASVGHIRNAFGLSEATSDDALESVAPAAV